jgi:hypothetical protein
MASLSQPFLNIEDSSFNVDILVFTRYDSNMNVKMLPKEDIMLQTLGNAALGNVVEDDVKDVLGVDAYISKLHLTNFEKQHATWKPYNCNSPTWVFFKVKNN